MNLAPAPAPAGREQARPAGGRFLTFALGPHRFGVPLETVAEISPIRELNRMPHMPKGVVGLLDLRGAVVPVVDLRIRIGLPADQVVPAENILILAIGGERVGAMVDRVEAVVTAEARQITPGSPLLVGLEGRWVQGFLLQNEEIIVLFETAWITAVGAGHSHQEKETVRSLERQLDDGLRNLIALAPHKGEGEGARIIPQMELAIAHSETEMGKVLARIEGMLAAADLAFNGLARLKQEAALGRLTGEEPRIAELERTVQQVQDRIFETLQTLQFQDIARQKLERVLNHIRGLQLTIGQKFRDAVRKD